MFKRTVLLLGVFMIVLQVFSFSQTGTPQFPSYNYNIIPPSPEVSSMAKFAEHNVGYATGKPQISIPLYSISCGKINIPVSIDYNSGGIKVEEIASSVGLGWALSAGGTISRSVVGMQDDYPGNGYLDNEANDPEELFSKWNQWVNSVPEMTDDSFRTIRDQIATSQLDVEPDMYFFNLPGKSGKFIINNHDKTSYTIPFEKINIRYERLNVSGRLNVFNRWVITTTDGTRYVYGKNLKGDNRDFSETNTNLRTDVRSTTQSVTTAWFLREIISADNLDTVQFNYATYKTGYCNQLAASMRFRELNDYQCVPAEENSYSSSSVESYIIESITGRFGKVLFSYDANRLDLYGGKSLRSFKVMNSAGQVVKEYEFIYSYFKSDRFPTPIPYCPASYSGSQNLRLKLDSLNQIDSKGNKISHVFEYDYNEASNRVLPGRLSNAQDHWGYFNGINNKTMVPRYPKNAEWTADAYVLDGANRRPSEDFTKIGTLKKIIYPTGGYSQYEYELNEAYAEDFIHDISLPNEEVPYVDYARVESNILLNPDVTGFEVVSAPFTVNNGNFRSQFAYFELGFIHPQYGNCDYDTRGDKPCQVLVHLIDETRNTTTPLAVGTRTALMPDGTYRLKMTVRDKTPYSADVVAYIKGPTSQPRLYNKKIGGLRIKSISDYDAISKTPSRVKKFKYTEADTSLRSSGKLNFSVQYHSFMAYKSNNGCSLPFFQRTTTSNLPLTSYSGSPVTYKRVEFIEEGNSSSIKSVFHYNTEGDLWGGAPYYPFPPGINMEHRRGLLQLKEEFKNRDNAYHLVRSTEYKYRESCMNTDPCSNRTWHYGLKNINPEWGFDENHNPSNSTMNLYKILAEWVIPSETIERVYDGPSSFIEKKTKYEYENPVHGQMTKSLDFINLGEVEISNIKYSSEYVNAQESSSDPQVKAIRRIMDHGAVLPIENLVTRKDVSGTEVVTGGTLLYYHPDGIKLKTIFSLSLKEPVPLSSFVRSHINSSGVFIKDSRYRELGSYHNYDAYGNIMNTGKAEDVNYAYLYDYRGFYPVCQVIGASSSEIAYTSFEAESSGSWMGISSESVTEAYSVTGNRSFSKDEMVISRSGLSPNGNYTISYWSRNGALNVNYSDPVQGLSINGWTYFEHRVNNPTNGLITVQGSGTIDELRLYPEKAHMNTYTFSPLLGVSSHADPKSMITYYEYDSFGRLHLIRDCNKSILKKICYSYMGQSEDCHN